MTAPAPATATAAPWDALSGQYQLCPGTPRSIVGQRPVLGTGQLGRLLRGQRGEQVGRTLSSVFTLCAHAHRRSAELALAAAQGEAGAAPPSPPPLLLWVETARDHLRSIALDWPQRLPSLWAEGPALDWLRDCPLPLATRARLDAAAAGAALDALRTWLEQHVLQQPVSSWLSAHRHPDALAHWCQAQAARLPPARCLAHWQPVAHSLRPELRGLNVLDADAVLQSAQLRQLAQTLMEQPDFAQQPTWLGQCFENGPWTRLRHRQTQATAPHSAWTRLSTRWLELIELAAASAPTQSVGRVALLATGAMKLGPGQALAWCEMARGLLLHWVQLDAQGAVQDYRVVAPTEWNFHPDGALARALAALPASDTLAASTLAAAFDPCVVCTIKQV
ncbi:MAG: hypothetical protein A3H24_04190 [Rhodoferax sp. RIFCSPLOWO2_12_FULL_60_11]|nr:MAG: hypothetical protein A3H24_04190 [Rhodoferax sp. RIFCSPLOWO2_12_FULL_60_11]